ncbi:MAG: DMT family transporter [Candidatus Babeliaceae bacterium]|nr:DMT family transporter [Candidatus Babeliaceae bacterium]
MLFLVVVLYALWGFTFTLGKVTIAYAHPLFIVGLRTLVSGLILISYIFLSKKMRCYPKRQDIALYVQIALFVSFLPHILRLWALQSMTTVKASLLFNTGPFFTAVLSYFLRKDRLTGLQIIGLFIGFSGMIPILLTDSAAEQLYTSWWFISLPELAVLAGVASFSYGLLLMQDLVKHRGCPPVLANGVSMLLAGCASLGLMVVSPVAPLRGNVWVFLGVFALQVLISNLFCSNLQAWLLKSYSPTFMSFASFLSPVFTAFYGVFLFKERITWHFFATFCMVVLGLGLYIYAERGEKQPECSS